MFRSLKTKFAKIALSALVMQLALIGAVAGPNSASAITVEPTDIVKPTLNVINYGGGVATAVSNNTFVLDISKSDDTTLQSGTINISENADLDASFLDSSVPTASLLSGDNGIDVAAILGGPVALADMKPIADFLGNVTLAITLTDFAGNYNDYQLILTVNDIEAPILTNTKFGGVPATNLDGTWSFNTSGLDDASFAALEVELNSTEDAGLTFLDYGVTVDLVKGNNVIKLSDIVGYNVTNKILNQIASNGAIIVSSSLTDLAGNFNLYNFKFSLDVTAPVVKVTSKPVIVNDVTKSLEIYFSADEPITLSSISLTQNNSEILDSLAPTKVDARNYKLVIAGNQFMAGVKSIFVTGTAKDLALNSTQINTEIKVDTIAIPRLSGFTGSASVDGVVTLNWNQVTATDIDSLQVYVDGVFRTSLPKEATSYVDYSAEKGMTHNYEIRTIDTAGNVTLNPYSLAVPALAPVIASVVSDTTSYIPSVVAEERAEVKADTSESKPEQKEEENKDGFPTWGIILLLILLGVGGYLYWTQRPAPIASMAPKTTPIATGKSKKKKK